MLTDKEKNQERKKDEKKKEERQKRERKRKKKIGRETEYNEEKAIKI